MPTKREKGAEETRLGMDDMYLAGKEVEISCVEVVTLRKVGHTCAEMTKLVHWSRPLLEPLEVVCRTVLLVWLWVQKSDMRLWSIPYAREHRETYIVDL